MTISSVISSYANYSNQFAEAAQSSQAQSQPPPQQQVQQSTPLPVDTVTLSKAALQASLAQQSSGDINSDGNSE